MSMVWGLVYDVMLPSRVPAHGMSPSLPRAWIWHLRTVMPPLERLTQSVSPSADDAQSSSFVQISPGFFVPDESSPNTRSHTGELALASSRQKVGFVDAA